MCVSPGGNKRTIDASVDAPEMHDWGEDSGIAEFFSTHRDTIKTVAIEGLKFGVSFTVIGVGLDIYDLGSAIVDLVKEPSGQAFVMVGAAGVGFVPGMDWVKTVARSKFTKAIAQKMKKGIPGCNCFVGGTMVLLGSGAQVPIEEVELGDRVHARAEVECDRDDEAELEHPVVELRGEREEAPYMAVELLRSREWVEANFPTEDSQVWFDLEHVGMAGWASLVSSAAYSGLEPGPGCPVTGTFRRLQKEFVTLSFEDGDTITATRAHPVFSVSRGDWVATGDVQSGEVLETARGDVAVSWVEAEDARVEAVFNLEVAGSHEYFVGELGVRAHNSSPTDCPIPGAAGKGKADGSGGQAGNEGPITEGLVYRSASGTPTSMTPRPKDSGGLSAANSTGIALPGKNQAIDTSKLTNLCAVCDNPRTGHVSIVPKDPSQMQGWIDSRGGDKVHPLTQELMDAVVDVVKK